VKNRSGSDLLELATSSDRNTQIQNPIHVISVRNEVMTQRRRVTVQNVIDD
jgi:hypothetical protein